MYLSIGVTIGTVIFLISIISIFTIRGRDFWVSILPDDWILTEGTDSFNDAIKSDDLFEDTEEVVKAGIICVIGLILYFMLFLIIGLITIFVYPVLLVLLVILYFLKKRKKS